MRSKKDLSLSLSYYSTESFVTPHNCHFTNNTTYNTNVISHPKYFKKEHQGSSHISVGYCMYGYPITITSREISSAISHRNDRKGTNHSQLIALFLFTVRMRRNISTIVLPTNTEDVLKAAL
eukprot:Tbor_TRINITY_DN4715_c0_g5::TRINITY_DN4715_c0_g5_i1::g.16974::m.16974